MLLPQFANKNSCLPPNAVRSSFKRTPRITMTAASRIETITYCAHKHLNVNLSLLNLPTEHGLHEKHS